MWPFIRSPHMHLNVLRSLIACWKWRKNILTCRQTSDFIEACQKKRHFDTPIQRRFAGFSKPQIWSTKKHNFCSVWGSARGVYLFENEVDGFVSQEYVDVPILLEDFKIIGGSRSFSIECETIKLCRRMCLIFLIGWANHLLTSAYLKKISSIRVAWRRRIYAHPSAFSRPEFIRHCARR